MPTTTEYLDESASEVRKLTAALFLVVAAGIAASFRPEPVGVALQILCLAVLGLAWLYAPRTHWSFSVSTAFALFVSGSSLFIFNETNGFLALALAVFGGISAYHAWKHRLAWLPAKSVYFVDLTEDEKTRAHELRGELLKVIMSDSNDSDITLQASDYDRALKRAISLGFTGDFSRLLTEIEQFLEGKPRD